jgi:hypothetical protein
MKAIITFFTLFLFSSFSGFSQKENVLFIGNSFTHMHALCRIYENIGNSLGKDIYADTIAVSGSTIKKHTQRSFTYKKLKKKSWDYVFIQAYSRELSYDSLTIETETVPYTKILIDSIKAHNPCAKIYFYMTWGYRDGFIDSIPTDTYNLMQERIIKGYEQLSKATGGYPIAPVGLVWREMRTLHPTINLYESDLFHPNIYGSYLAATTLFSSSHHLSPKGAKHPRKIEDSTALIIEELAFKTTKSSWKTYNLDTIQLKKNGAKPVVDFVIQQKYLSVTVLNKIPVELPVHWDFGDGSTSNHYNAKHYYKKPGKYTITLSVKYNCIWYDYTKVVKVAKNNTSKKKKAS